MTEDEFRRQFDRDRNRNKLTFVADYNAFGIAVGIGQRWPSPNYRGCEPAIRTIVLHVGGEIDMADARFIGETALDAAEREKSA
jgi:hypothetical protein